MQTQPYPENGLSLLQRKTFPQVPTTQTTLMTTDSRTITCLCPNLSQETGEEILPKILRHEGHEGPSMTRRVNYMNGALSISMRENGGGDWEEVLYLPSGFYTHISPYFSHYKLFQAYNRHSNICAMNEERNGIH